MAITLEIDPRRVKAVRDPMLYGHFLEHFHRQVYRGIFDPGNPLSDADGFRTDVIEAMKRIRVPVIRWPGGCFVSTYHWHDGVGKTRVPSFDKSWRVEEPNTFGTDEFVKLCRKIGCEPYICTNAGTGSIEEMSDWVEYCNLPHEGEFARERIENGYPAPHRVKYWSIGNENYGHWELGAKSAEEWPRLVREAAKLMSHVDPTVQLSAAALPDLDWTYGLLKHCGPYLKWISLHQYWDMMPEKNEPADYEAAMAFTWRIDRTVRAARGMLDSLDLTGKISIAFDEWNLRSWHHPRVHSLPLGVEKDDYLTPRDKNDDNSMYTMADAVFSACFLNAMNRHADVVKMANFAPILNTRGAIMSHPDGLVLRSTYHVFDLYVNRLGDTVVDLFHGEPLPLWRVKGKDGDLKTVESLDLLATKWSDRKGIALAAVNKHPRDTAEIILTLPEEGQRATLFTLNGPDENAYNDVGRNEIGITETALGLYQKGMRVVLPPHSVNILQIV